MKSNNFLIDALEHEIICFTDDILNTEKGKMLVSEYEKKLKEIGWNPDEKIKITKRGEYKTSTPIQICIKNRIEVLKRIYNYYYGDDNSNLTLEECFNRQMERFDKLVKGEARSTESAALYRSNYKRFVGEYPIAKLPNRTIKVRLVYEHLENIAMEQKLSTAGLRDARIVLGKAFAYAYNHDIIPTNIMDGIDTSDIAVQEVNNDERVYTECERDKLLVVMNDEKILSSYRKSSLARVAARALSLAFCIPIRNGEVRSFLWDDVDWTEGDETIYIHSQIRRFHDEEGKQRYLYSAKTKAKKKKGERTPALCDFAVDILKKQRKESPDDAVYIFESNGKPLSENTLNQWLKRFCEHAGVEYLPTHCIRFYAVTALNNSGVEKGKIQKTAGHCSAQTTDHYIRNERSENITKEEANRTFKAPTKSYQKEG